MSERIDLEHDRIVDPDRDDGALGWLIGCMAHEASPGDYRNIRRYGMWMIIWALIVVADADWFGGVEGETSAISVALAIAAVIALIMVVASFARYVRQTDELNRSIQLRALALGFAGGFLASMIGEAAQDAGLVDRVDIDVPSVVMLVTYAVTSVVITRRYR